MKFKWMIVFSLTFVIGCLTGCGQLESVVDDLTSVFGDDAVEESKEVDVVEQESNGTESTETVQEEEMMEEDVVEEPVEEPEEESQEQQEEAPQEEPEEQPVQHVASDLPFDDLLLEQGYDLLTLPNGFPFSVPYHWILVEEQSSAHGFHGTFCYELPLEIEEVSAYFSFFDEIAHENQGPGADYLHTTTFKSDFGFSPIEGSFNYYKDEFDNMCVDTIYSFEGLEDESQYGEDPDTMVSEEELAEMMGMADESEINDSMGMARDRTTPSDYEAMLQAFEMEGFVYTDLTNVGSIQEKISNGEIEMLHLLQGFPKMFPYEWYLMEESDDPQSSQWSGKYCTDFSFEQTIIKHHRMLADHDADINALAFNDGDINDLSYVQYAFNDEYGTGSWEGTSQFYLDNDLQCIDVIMQFSDQILQ